MKCKYHFPSLAVALVATGLIATTPADASDAWIQSAQRSQEGSSISWGEARGVVEQPFERVLSVVQDYGNYNQFLPFRTSKVLARRGNKAMVYLEVGVMKDTVTLWGQLRIGQIKSLGASKVIEASLIEGNVDDFKARWELTPVDGGKRTRVDFRILVDPDLPLPSSVFTRENVKAARRAVRALRHRLERIHS